MPLLEVSDVVAGYGETDILHGVSIAVDEGEIVTIIGPNGCGKSTLMKAVVGLVRVKAGAVTFRGTDIASQPPERIVRTGLCYVPQSANVFPSLSIRENLEMGGFVRNDDYRGRIEELFELFPDLARRPTQQGGPPVGRAASDAGHCPCPDAGPGAAAAGRSLRPGCPRRLWAWCSSAFGASTGPGSPCCWWSRTPARRCVCQSRGYVLASGRNRLEASGPALLDNPEVARLYLGGRR